MRLNWRGATSANVDIFRNNVLIATQPNSVGQYTDSTGDTGRAQYIYRVCEAGTATCSNDVLCDSRSKERFRPLSSRGVRQLPDAAFAFRPTLGARRGM